VAPPVGVPRVPRAREPVAPGAAGLAGTLDDLVEVSEPLAGPAEREELAAGDGAVVSVSRCELPHPAHSRITGSSVPASRRLMALSIDRIT